MAEAFGIVVPHTHWDREWYLTYQEYRLRLVRVLDRLLELFEAGWSVPCFIMDGQTSVLEDYLELRPENERRLTRLISKGRLKVGPWYTQPDEFLCSPESMIRNLLIARKMAERKGWVIMEIGYVPDTFGHVSTLPTIFSGFGLDTFVFTRGLGDEARKLPLEFIWEAPDGSKLLASYLFRGYCAMMGLGYLGGSFQSRYAETPEGWGSVYLDVHYREPSIDLDEALKRVQGFTEMARKRSSTGVLLFMNGCDHLPPQSSIAQIVGHINACSDSVRLKMGSFEEYFKEVKKRLTNPEVHRGEMRGCLEIPLLWGVTSTRTYLKQENYRATSLLESYAEPLLAIAWFLGADLPDASVELAWKLVLQNQAHDSIYGTGVDPLHRENESRFLQAIGIASNLAYDSLRYIGERMKKTSVSPHDSEIVVFNPHLCDLPVPVVFQAQILDGPMELVDDTGDSFPVQAIGSSGGSSIVTGLSDVCSVLVLPQFGIKKFGLRKHAATHYDLPRGPSWIENEYFKVEAAAELGGMLRVTDKELQRVFDGFNVFIDEGDAGDSYDYSPPKEDRVIRSDTVSAEVTSYSGPVRASLRLRTTIMVPSASDGNRRSSILVPLPIISEVILWKNVPRIDFKVDVDNSAKDHRFRVEFPLGFEVRSSTSEGHFSVVSRSKTRPTGEGWVEKPPQTHPALSWVDASNGTLGLMIANKGTPEYELTEDGKRLLITLFRSIGWLSKEDLPIRPGHAGPGTETPDAQMIGKWRFEYSAVLHRGDWKDSYMIARGFSTPPFAITVSSLSERAETNRSPCPCQGKQHPSSSRLSSTVESVPKSSWSILSNVGDEVSLTAFKKGAPRGSLLFRIADLRGEGAKPVLIVGTEARAIRNADFSEKPIGQIPSSRNQPLQFSMKPNEVKTILFYPRRPRGRPSNSNARSSNKASAS